MYIMLMDSIQEKSNRKIINIYFITFEHLNLTLCDGYAIPRLLKAHLHLVVSQGANSLPSANMDVSVMLKGKGNSD